MLRRLKMELKKQDFSFNVMDQQQQQQQQQHAQQVGPLMEIEKTGKMIHSGAHDTDLHKVINTQPEQQRQHQHQQQQQQKVRRVRGRRSSKPLMEKRRRARINQCLDILKTYVLTDTNNLTHLGIDRNASENQDEETIARTILKSSGLINRHRGRKNPNKLEKADILELTVDYVRRLHDQRDSLLVLTTEAKKQSKQHTITTPDTANSFGLPQKPINSPLHLKLPVCLQTQPTPPSPPPSSASSSPQPLLSISTNNSNHLNYQQQTDPNTLDILDLSDSSKRFKVRHDEWSQVPDNNGCHINNNLTRTSWRQNL